MKEKFVQSFKEFLLSEGVNKSEFQNESLDTRTQKEILDAVNDHIQVKSLKEVELYSVGDDGYVAIHKDKNTNIWTSLDVEFERHGFSIGDVDDHKSLQAAVRYVTDNFDDVEKVKI